MTREDVVKALRAHMQSKLDEVMPNSEGVNKKYIEEAYFTRKAKFEAILAKPMTTKPSSSIDDESIIFLHTEKIASNSEKWTVDEVVFFVQGLYSIVGLFTCMGRPFMFADLVVTLEARWWETKLRIHMKLTWVTGSMKSPLFGKLSDYLVIAPILTR